MTKRTTIKDVAHYAGTSYQTVSRVINNKPDVAPATRKRVLEAIEKLNYRPTMAATSRANPKTNILAVAISPYNQYLLYEGDPHLLKMIHGVDRALAVRNYNLLISTIQYKSGKAIESRLFDRQLADGVIIRLSMNDRGETAQLFNDKEYPVVVVGYSQNTNVPSIRSDDDHGGYIQTQHLLALGHKRIALITGPDDDPATLMRLKGHQRAIGNSGIIANRVIGNYAVNSGYDAVASLMQQHPDVTAIAAHNDTMAIGAMQWLHQHGYKIPDDISIIGYDDISDAQRQATPLTTIRIPSMEEGQKAVQVLFDVIEGRYIPTSEIVLPVNLVVRNSTDHLKE